jgi:hypothetical protein
MRLEKNRNKAQPNTVVTAVVAEGLVTDVAIVVVGWDVVVVLIVVVSNVAKNLILISCF